MAYCSKSKANAKNQSGENDEIKQSVQLEAVTKHLFYLSNVIKYFKKIYNESPSGYMSS